MNVTVFNQLIQPDTDARELCGECETASALLSLNMYTSPLMVSAAIRGHFGGEPSTQNGTTETELMWYLAFRGVASRDWNASQGSLVPGLMAALAANHPVLVCVRDDNDADPSASGCFTHWLWVYRNNGDGTVQCGNSWPVPNNAPTGRNIAYPIAVMAAAFVVAVEILQSTAPAPAAVTTENDMLEARTTHPTIPRHDWVFVRDDKQVMYAHDDDGRVSPLIPWPGFKVDGIDKLDWLSDKATLQLVGHITVNGNLTQWKSTWKVNDLTPTSPVQV